jgi:TIGR03009 family protein
MPRIAVLVSTTVLGLVIAGPAHAQGQPGTPRPGTAPSPASTPRPANSPSANGSPSQRATPPAASKAAAHPAPAPAPAPAPVDPAQQARLDQLLREWEQRSASIKTLDASYLRLDQNQVLGEVEFYEGRALLQSPNLACLDTHKLTIDPKAEAKLFGEALKWAREQQGSPDPKTGPIPPEKRKFYDRVICTGQAIYHYDGAVQQIFEYPLSSQEQTATLQQGPLPFLFNMRRDEVSRRYHLRLYKEDDEKFTIQIVPKLDIDRNAFAQAIIYLNKKTFLPDILQLVEPNQNRQTYYLTRVKPNEAINEANFRHLPNSWRGWELVKNPPLGEPQPQAGGNRAAPAPPRTAVQGDPSAKPPAGANRR